MTQWEVLKREAKEKVAHLLPNRTFDDFEDPNSRMLIAVTCLQRGEKELAYDLFETVAAEGPFDNENRRFAYVRSLVELAEMDAEKEQFESAEQRMGTALADFPEGMDYMMSRTHLDVYLTYYRFRLGKRKEAENELKTLIQREEERFREHHPEDGRNLVGPGLCYAIHQLSLFHAEQGDWAAAVEIFRRLRPYAAAVDDEGWNKADRLVQEGSHEEAYQKLSESVSYGAG
ncbi:hypothetical protein [Paludifilum halophilum]|uniref:Tetratricopeptide repeat protein n=1 Tax=Paludifilum halophilum TaxID=1642702 RepID=A0A235B4X8_9BACL|nr:hypothetical protein [Paludifilum halophilum]OYD07366.1 hypothetical protein CHM34_10675 [Paludifilum halophilum]